jgi:hypothetical protein
MRTPFHPLAFAVLLAALTACADAGGGRRSTSADTTSTAEPAGVVDSVFPMSVMLDRFRAGMAEPAGLTSGADSRDGLVEAMVRAVEARDTAAFAPLTVSMAEWAWLYFPTSVQAGPPYELPPALAWFQLQEGNRIGLLRALERLGGRKLDYRGYTCDPDPTVEGANRVWIGCLVTLGRDGEEPAPVRIFSAILERDGRFTILSFANDF